MSKIQVKYIVLIRLEGGKNSLNEKVTSYSDANRTLRKWKETAPTNKKDFHQCKFTVVFEDNEEYEDTIELRNINEFDINLRLYIRQYLEVFINNDKAYQVKLRLGKYNSTIKEFIEKYDI
ncbi:hypothetical protein KCM76_22335 [Zooshikella marina]|uniref:hypothetical protein n=1 Tax=Zooshikella ganghwensis TaxID=202772 RepID=UPI001BB08B87|nr:hypothetical protein [Zooshikella ganghwensis]MBU2708748.1 hypothetical protein [Zooshikella ganghwensis]